MENLKDLFVSKEISIKLKEKGFDEPCLAVYRGGSLYFDKMICGYASDLSEKTDFSTNSDFDKNFLVNKTDKNYWITAPMKNQVIDWFRDNHKMLIQPQPNSNEYKVIGWGFGLLKESTLTDINQAIEQAIKLI
jgi:hypothetical protein